MFTPDGQDAGKMDRIMLLAMWAKNLINKNKNNKSLIIEAGMGKPTFPANQTAAAIVSNTWQNIHSKSSEMRNKLRQSAESLPETNPGKSKINIAAPNNSEQQSSYYLIVSLFKRFWKFVTNIFTKETSLTPTTAKEIRDDIVKAASALDYGHPQGDLEAREKLADAFTRWYGSNEYELTDFELVKFRASEMIFTVGEAAAINAIGTVIEQDNPYGRVVITFPYYSLYAQVFNKNELHPINTMNQPGYKLTAAALQKSLEEAQQKEKIDGRKINAIVLCNPNNPTSTIIDKDELIKIAEILRVYLKANPKVKILLDEAYAEMQLDGKKPLSLLQVAPDLKQHIVLMRSGTKGMSMAGERMAGAAIFDPAFMAKVLENTIKAYGHPPRTLQFAFAEAVLSFSDEEHQQIINFYKPQVEFVAKRLQEMGAAMPAPAYKPEGTFYVMADLSDLLGTEIFEEAKSAVGADINTIITDEHLIYDLLFRENIMIAPLSYYGWEAKKGHVRITCSNGDSQLTELMNRIEQRLHAVRLQKLSKLQEDCQTLINSLGSFEIEFDSLELKYLCKDINSYSAKQLKEINQQYEQLLSKLTKERDSRLYSGKESSIIKIQSLFRDYSARKFYSSLKRDKEWMDWVRNNVSKESEQNRFFAYTPDERMNFKPWKNYLANKQRFKMKVHQKAAKNAKMGDTSLRASSSSPDVLYVPPKEPKGFQPGKAPVFTSEPTTSQELPASFNVHTQENNFASQPKVFKTQSFAGTPQKPADDINNGSDNRKLSSKSSPDLTRHQSKQATGKAELPQMNINFWKVETVRNNQNKFSDERFQNDLVKQISYIPVASQ